MTRILFIAQFFPPLGGAGTQRSLKFVKYLPSCGVLPVVLTGEGRPTGRWSPEDLTMLTEVPSEVEVVRVAWGGDRGAREAAMIEVGESAGRRYRVSSVLVSMSPFEDAEVAAEVARRLAVPWVADMRDPWALDEFRIYRTRWHRARERRRMGKALASASLVAMNTPEAAERLRRAFPGVASGRVVSVTNGYDAEDFVDEPMRSGPRFTVVHNGYLHADSGLRLRRWAWRHRLLGGVVGGVRTLSRSHYFLLQALDRWQREDPRVAETVSVELIGLPTDADRQLVNASRASVMVSFSGYLNHQESIRRVRGADLLFLPMHTLPHGMRSGIVPGKTYEYLASGRAILAAVPAGDARDFLEAAGTASVCQPEDVDGMLRILKERFAAWERGEAGPVSNRQAVERFERRQLTAELAGHLRAIMPNG